MNKTDSWATLFKTFQRLHQSMEQELKELELPNLETYDVLWTLEQAPDHALRLSDLGKKVYLAKFNITRICDKLAESGLIEKIQCPQDKRGVWAKMTIDGLKLRKKIWNHYKKLINEKYSSLLNEHDHQLIVEILSKIKIDEN